MDDDRQIAAIPSFWTRQYAYYLNEHRHPMNRMTHLFGIPIIIVTLIIGIYRKDWRIIAGGQIVGWAFQLVGHRIEGNKPALLKNPISFLMGPLMVITEFLELLGFTFHFAEEARKVVHGAPTRSASTAPASPPATSQSAAAK